MLERVLLIRVDPSLVSTGFTLDASLDLFYLYLCAFGCRPLKQLMNPKSDLFDIEEG